MVRKPVEGHPGQSWASGCGAEAEDGQGPSGPRFSLVACDIKSNGVPG